MLTDSNQASPMQPSVKMREIRKPSGPWLHAWYDPMAQLRTSQSRVATMDVNNDGNYSLLVIDDSRRLKVFRDMNLVSSHKLLDDASAMAVFYPANAAKKATMAAVGVATGPNVYIYRNMRPYYKFTLPRMEVDTVELNTWDSYKKKQFNAETALDILTDYASKTENKLTFRTMFILSITDRNEQLRYLETYKNAQLIWNTVITCLASLKRDSEEETSPSALVLGTEDSHIHILDCSGTTIIDKLAVPSIPAYICTVGAFSVDYRLVIGTRNGTVFSIKNGKLLANVIQLESPIVAMTIVNKLIVIGCMNEVLYAYTLKGTKQFSLYFKQKITCVEPLSGHSAQNKHLMLIGLFNGEVHLYDRNVLIHSLKFESSPITALKFGHYGLESNAMAIINSTGALTVKIMSRKADLDKPAHKSGPPPEQDTPLALPPVTQLYIDQTNRERENAENMHQSFQRDIVKFRLKTAKEYVRILSKGEGSIVNVAGKQLLLNIQVSGLGPLFHINIELKNTGKEMIDNLVIICSYDRQYYIMDSPLLNIPMLVPQIMYKYKMAAQSIDRNGAAASIRLCIAKNGDTESHFPLLSAIVDMPIADVVG